MTLATVPMVDIEMHRGHDKEIRMVIYDHKDTIVFNLTNHRVWLKLTPTWSRDETALKLEGVIANHSNGTVKFFITPEHTKELLTGTYDMEISVVFVSGYTWVAYMGKLGLLPSNAPSKEPFVIPGT